MYEITVRAEFSAAHSLRGYEGACERLHGHNYKVEAVLGGERLDDQGMLVDFKQARAALGEVLDRLDHRFLNDIRPFDEVNPSAENLARHIAEEWASRVPAEVGVRRVTVWESDRCGATYVP